MYDPDLRLLLLEPYPHDLIGLHELIVLPYDDLVITLDAVTKKPQLIVLVHQKVIFLHGLFQCLALILFVL